MDANGGRDKRLCCLASFSGWPALAYTAYQNSDYDPFLGILDMTFKALLQGVIGFCPLKGQDFWPGPLYRVV